LKENLLTLPGSMFGPEQESFLRIAFANVEIDSFPEMMNRLKNFAPEV
jgi:aspartate/methionine/tyrosine aminotransferase